MYFDTVSPISERRKLNRPISQWILGAYILHGTENELQMDNISGC